jgi:DUF4097 and DUF4098 domain-containing protein YvlB
MKLRVIIIILFILSLGSIFTGCIEGVNKSVRVGEGETSHRGRSTVNGSVYIGDNAKVLGNCSTVNGKIQVGENCQVRSLSTVNRGVTIGSDTEVDGKISTVNGSVTCEESVQVDGNISTVNGSITCRRGVRVDGKLSNVNGDIKLTKTVIKDDIHTHTGDLVLADHSIVEGDIIILRSRNVSIKHREITIHISGESVVKGDIINRDEKLDVKIILMDGGTVEGKVEDAEVIKK